MVAALTLSPEVSLTMCNVSDVTFLTVRISAASQVERKNE